MKVLPPSKGLQKINGAPWIQCAVYNGSAFLNASVSIKWIRRYSLFISLLVIHIHTIQTHSPTHTYIYKDKMSIFFPCLISKIIIKINFFSKRVVFYCEKWFFVSLEIKRKSPLTIMTDSEGDLLFLKINDLALSIWKCTMGCNRLLLSVFYACISITDNHILCICIYTMFNFG